MSATLPTLGKVHKVTGVAGQYGYRVDVTYAEDYDGLPEPVTFIGSAYGGPIIMCHTLGGAEHQCYVSRAVLDRIGSELTPTWVRRFFGLED